MRIEFDYRLLEPSLHNIELIGKITNMTPQTNTETPNERYEIVGDVVETENVIDPNKKKQENDQDKKNEKPDITIN